MNSTLTTETQNVEFKCTIIILAWFKLWNFYFTISKQCPLHLTIQTNKYLIIKIYVNAKHSCCSIPLVFPLFQTLSQYYMK